ncbi:MAG: diaminohydroxyphosphoribosylaminopyrimidine deaminase [Bacteroidota bacterium]|nr:diaminohydroxyphosphoribosylaminopyrimidine deaminase [Bacteroidota bacterium]
MERCLVLAKKGMGKVAPNPMVGCVIVHNDEIIGEGYHEEYGKAHAEVNAINSVKDKSLLKKATLYVNLEPCSHFGKTPPCADLIIEHKIPFVVVGTIDTFSQVSGRGIEKLVKAGIDVKTGILEAECKELNKRFFNFHEKKRPYVILKWAQTQDGFIDILRTEEGFEKALKITNEASTKLSHTWRSVEQAIIVGKRTAVADNPQLTVRSVQGKNPLRIAIDRNLTIPNNYFLLDGSTPTLIYTSADANSENNLEYKKLNFDEVLIPQILNDLAERNIQSLIVEGGTKLINSFIQSGIWDEARVFISQQQIEDGVNAPILDLKPVEKEDIEGDILLTYKNN